MLLCKVEHDIRIRLGQVFILVRAVDAGHEVADDIEPGLLLVIGPHDVPGQVFAMGPSKHFVARVAVIVPAPQRALVNGADLPLLERINPPICQSFLLFGFRYVEIILEKLRSGATEHALEWQNGAHELLVFCIRAEPHHLFDAGPVVPAAVHDDHFFAGRQAGDIALKVPAVVVAVGGFAESNDPGVARAEMRGKALDHAVLSRSIPAFEQDQDAEIVFDQVSLQFYQFDLKAVEGLLVALGLRCGLPFRFLAHCRHPNPFNL